MNDLLEHSKVIPIIRLLLPCMYSVCFIEWGKGVGMESVATGAACGIGTGKGAWHCGALPVTCSAGACICVLVENHWALVMN